MRKNLEQVLLEEYSEDQLGLPYPIKIKNGVYQLRNKDTGEVMGTAITNLDGLLRLLAVQRCGLPNALTGEEVKFLRNVRNIKAKDMALELGIAPETLSRIEHNKAPLKEAVERLIRVYSCLDLSQHEGMPPVDYTVLRTMGRRAAFSDGEGPEFGFELKIVSAEEVWNQLDEAA